MKRIKFCETNGRRIKKCEEVPVKKTAVATTTIIASSNSSTNKKEVTVAISNDGVSMQTVFSSNAVDMFFKGSANLHQPRVLTDNPYYDYTNEIGYQAMVFPGIGTIAKYTNPYPITGSTDEGYHALESDFISCGNDDYATWGDGVASYNWSNDFVLDFNALVIAMGITGDVCFKALTGTTAQLQWYIDNFNPSMVAMGAEYSNSDYTAAQYNTAVTALITYIKANAPTIKICLDAVPVYKGSVAATTWNIMITSMLSQLRTGDQCRYYLQIGDRCTFTSSVINNVAALKNYFDVLLPADLVSFRAKFPNMGMNIGQWNIEDSGTQYVNKTMLGLWAIGKCTEFFLKNTATVNYVAWMSHKNLIDRFDVTDINYTALKALAPLYGYSKVNTITLTLADGVTGVAVSASGSYVLLLNNYSDVSVKITNVTIGGIKINTSISTHSFSATTWDGTILDQTISENGKITLPAHCMAVITLL